MEGPLRDAGAALFRFTGLRLAAFCAAFLRVVARAQTKGRDRSRPKLELALKKEAIRRGAAPGGG
jgi:hypothetical protein